MYEAQSVTEFIRSMESKQNSEYNIQLLVQISTDSLTTFIFFVVRNKQNYTM